MNKLLKFEFENRIFISLSIVAVIYTLSITIFQNSPSMLVLIGSLLGLSASLSIIAGYLVLAVGMLVICVLRMWAGTILSSQTVMSFQVRSDSLQIVGPYILIRNPIYLADLSAITCFSLCMPLVAVLMPVLFYLHYVQLIRYEEISFSGAFSEEMESYKRQTPRLFPSVFSLKNFLSAGDRMHINYDGLRHNALYLLFIPGFLVAAAHQDFLYAVLIGVPGVIDWAIVHTKIGLNKDKPSEKMTDSDKIKKSKVFEDVLYAQCWEDPSIDRTAFNMKQEDVLFSITSGGCNVMTFLLDDPQKIIALDISPYQNYLLELKIACFKGLDYLNLLKFVGINPSENRLNMYKEIRDFLSENARKYWDQNLEKIKNGIMHCGRYEKYMRLLGSLLNLLIGKKVINRMFLTKNFKERIQLYDQKWNTIRWKICTKIMLSRKMMSLLFDKAFFAYLEDSFSFGDHFAQKTEQAFKKLPVRENSWTQVRYVYYRHIEYHRYASFLIQQQLQYHQLLQNQLDFEPVK